MSNVYTDCQAKLFKRRKVVKHSTKEKEVFDKE